MADSAFLNVQFIKLASIQCKAFSKKLYVRQNIIVLACMLTAQIFEEIYKAKEREIKI
jgi:hypothetical protein